MTNLSPGARPATPRWLAVALAAMVVWPASQAPTQGAAGVPGPELGSAATRSIGTDSAAPESAAFDSVPVNGGALDPGAELLASGGSPTVLAGSEGSEPEPRTGDVTPSIHYRDEQAHAGDAPAFEPGGLVTVPFSPRADDAWTVDGLAPRTLPAGDATGRQMHDERQGSVWSPDVPAGHARLVQRALAADRNLDARTIDDGITAELTSMIAPPSGAGVEAAPVGPGGLRREVFGFLPWWEMAAGSTVLDWRTLSTVAYFSVGCTGGGSLQKKNPDGSTAVGWAGWTSSKMTSIINAAHAHRTRVVLTVACFAWSSSGAAIQAGLLGSASARTKLARQIAAAVRDRGADGVNLDFEPIVSGYAPEFTALVRSVRKELNRVAKGYQLTFDTMGALSNEPIAAATAPGGADAVFIMGYDYRTGSSPQVGSISPLSGPAYDLTDTIRVYSAKISPSKIILGVPYYGRAWSTSSGALHAENISGAKNGSTAAPTYAQAVDIVAAHGRRWDPVEQAPWTAYRKQTCTAAHGCVSSWRQLYYDDAASLRARYDLVNRAGLRGAGIWALGYDNARPELRAALADKFVTDRTAPVAGIVTFPPEVQDEAFRVAWTSYDDSPIRGYDVQVSIDGGGWSAWLKGTTQTSSIYPGVNGRTYAFRVRATDARGNVSSWNKGPARASVGTPRVIAVGGFLSVAIGGLRMRARPSTGAATMATLSRGDALQVIGGPVKASGYTWYQVAGPVRQWPPVDSMQLGGWVATAGNGVTNAVPRRAAFATRVNAGLVGLRLNAGGERALTPNGDGKQDKLRLAWINRGPFDSISLQVYRENGTLAGSLAVARTASGNQTFDWDGRIGGMHVPSGVYVVQLQGRRGTAVFSSPSASPVSAAQIVRFGVVVVPVAPTAVVAFHGPTLPSAARSLAWTLTFGGAVGGLAAGDFTRTGTATGCVIRTPTGSGATWTVVLTGCRAGTVTLRLKAHAVFDAVRNVGPESQVNATTLVIDRLAPVAAKPRLALRVGIQLPSAAASAELLAALTLSGTDRGGAGIRGYDVKRSIDGGPFSLVALDAPGTLFVSLLPGHAYHFAVRARDRAGNVGAWVSGPAVRAWLRQETAAAITWKGPWAQDARPQYSGAAVSYASASGASAGFAFTGRAIAWVSTFNATRGAAKVYLDGTLVATIDTHAARTTNSRVAFARAWASSGPHTLRIVVSGPAMGPRLDIDAFEVLQ